MWRKSGAIDHAGLVAAVEQAADAVIMTDVAGTILYVNPAFTAMTGYTSAEAVGGTPHILKSGHHPQSFYEELWTTIRSGRIWRGEVINRRKNGTFYCEEMRIAPVQEENGRIARYIAIKHDVTERRAAEEALKESEQRFRIMADGCPAMMWVTDAAGRCQFINRAFRQFCGITDKQWPGERWPLQLHPEDAPEYVAALRRARLEQTSFSAEARVRRADGQWRWVASHAEPRFSPNGAYLGHVGLSPDITRRKDAEQGLRSSEEKFRQLAENIHEVFWMMPVEADRILYVSPAYEQVWGRTCASLYHNPTSWSEAIHPDDRERAHRLLQGEPLVSEYRIQTSDGQEKWIRDRAFPIHNEAGKLIRIAGIAEEITCWKRYEEDLIRARVDADAANRAKSRFLANMSHELRTPLNGVLGMVQLLLMTDLSPEQRRYVSIAETSGRSLLSVIDAVLDLAKIEAQKIVIEKCPFDIRQVIDDVVQVMSLQAHAKGLTLGSRVSADMPASVVGDAHRVRQVLTNLCGNAVKFTERGEVTLAVALETHDEGAALARFTVTDTGIGIPGEHSSTIFSPFVQADSSTTRKFGGTGLGLSICKGLVELMGGSIGVHSREGCGSTFWFTVRFGLDPTGRTELARQSAAALAGQAPETARGAHILVAEDNETNREVVLAQLRRLGYGADAAGNGAEAVRAVRQTHYDLVLMDCQMPVMDGFEATRQIRSLYPNLPVVAVTADAMSGDRERCLSEGMNDYVAKPVDMGRLAEVLARWLTRPLATIPEGIGEEHPPQPPQAIFDEHGLLRRLLGDRRLAGVVVNGFLQDAPAQLNQLRMLLEKTSDRGVRMQAHALKGAAATASAETLRALALTIERGGLERCIELLPRAVEEFARYRKNLEDTGWVETEGNKQ